MPRTTFWDDVRDLVDQGMIPRVWSRFHLRRRLRGKYKASTIKTYPSHYCEKTGSYVRKRGAKPRVRRRYPGRYELIE